MDSCMQYQVEYSAVICSISGAFIYIVNEYQTLHPVILVNIIYTVIKLWH